MVVAIVSQMAFSLVGSCQPPNTQMQPTVINKVPLSCVRRAAADLGR